MGEAKLPPGDGAALACVFAAAFLRAIAIGMIGLVLGLSLNERGVGPQAIGVVVAAGLAGSAVASALAGWGDRLGRKRFLVAQALIGAAGGLLLPLASGSVLLAAVAFGGMVNGMGRDRGAAQVVETAILPGLVKSRSRTWVFAWYTLIQDAGHALGAVLAGLPAWLAAAGLVAGRTGFQIAYLVYSGLLLGGGLLYAVLPAGIESPEPRRDQPLSPTTRRHLGRLSALFALDSIGGGFLTAALVAYFLAERFGVGPAAIGALYFGGRIANAASHAAAAWLAGRIGLIRTMVFTHVPSSLLLLGVGLAPTFPVAAACFLLRESLVEMDVPTRQSYVTAIVRPEERAAASAITSLVRQGGWAVGPAIAGLAAARLALAAPLFIGAGLKILYDILLFAAFRGLKPEEER